MTDRDWFAAAAIAGTFARPFAGNLDVQVRNAWEAADKMLAAKDGETALRFSYSELVLVHDALAAVNPDTRAGRELRDKCKARVARTMGGRG